MEKLESQLRERAESLGLSVEQKSKAMKQRDRKVNFTFSLLTKPELFTGDRIMFVCLDVSDKLNSLVFHYCALKSIMEMLFLLHRWSLRLSTALASLYLSIKTM